MTRDHRRKKVIRAQAAATGSRYMAAASVISGDTRSPVLAEALRDALAGTVEAAGWPVEIEWHPQAAALRLYAGPATIEVARAEDPEAGLTGDEHPDDAAVFDLSTPLRVTLWAPLIIDFDPELHRVAGVDAHPVFINQPIEGIAAEIDQVVGAARQRDLAATPARVECGICGDRYPTAAMFMPTHGQTVACPCCVFDGDLLGASPAYLAFQMDRARDRSLALPAGWSAVQVLLCCLAGHDLGQRLHAEWRDSGTLFEPSEVWSDSPRAWIWLPPAARRPAALADLGCGAALAAVAAAIDRAHPDLRKRYRARRDAELADYRGDVSGDDADSDDDALPQVPEETVERFWPAVIAYVVAMLTQQVERPGHRAPWHVLQSFELEDWVSILDPELDSYQVETVLRVGIRTVLDVLDPTETHEE